MPAVADSCANAGTRSSMPWAMASSRCSRCSSQLVSTVTASSVGTAGPGVVPLDRRGLGVLQGFAASAGMHGDQFRPQRRRPQAPAIVAGMS